MLRATDYGNLQARIQALEDYDNVVQGEMIHAVIVLRIDQLIPSHPTLQRQLNAYGVSRTRSITASTTGAISSYAFLFG